MKNLRLFILILSCFSIVNCSDFNVPDEDLAGTDLKNASSVAVFTVEPSGGDDTPALCAAFMDAKAAGSGSVVQLCEGEYHVGYMEVYDFCGFLQGAGKEKTIITAIKSIDIDELWANYKMACQFKFIGGNVHISQLTMRTSPGSLSDGGPGMGHIYALLNFSSTSGLFEPGDENRTIKAAVDNVCFKGQLLEGGPGYLRGYNCMIAVRAGSDNYNLPEQAPRDKVDLCITNCSFDTFCYGPTVEGVKNSTIVIGEKNRGNVCNYLDQGGGIWEFRDINLIVEGNTFNVPGYGYGWDIYDYPYIAWFQDEPSTTATLCNFQFNEFNLPHAEYALIIYNMLRAYYDDIPVAVQIKNNKFNMSDGYVWGVISYFTKGMVIRNNQFSGHGEEGLHLCNYSEEGLVLGNNFSSATFDLWSIYLTPSTRNWTVVGGNLKDEVNNLGVDNIITGVNVSSSDIPLGKTIKEKLPPMNHLMH